MFSIKTNKMIYRKPITILGKKVYQKFITEEMVVCARTEAQKLKSPLLNLNQVKQMEVLDNI